MNKILSLIFSLLLLPLFAQAQKSVPAEEMYMFAVAFTPLDSTVYITDMQPVKGARVYKKSKLLFSSNEYSAQVKNFLAGTGLDRMVVAVSYATKRTKAEKKYVKMKQKYQKAKYLVKYITATDFAFSEVPYDAEEDQVAVVEKPAKKKKKS